MVNFSILNFWPVKLAAVARQLIKIQCEEWRNNEMQGSSSKWNRRAPGCSQKE